MEIEGAYGTRLHVTEFGGTGPGILLLHGLTDHAATWASTASWLTAYGRVVAYDARGHGTSERPDGPYTRDAYVGDAAAVIERLGLGPALVIGHSMGGLTAWQLAGRRPELVRGIVVGDMSPVTPVDAVRSWRDWLASWPVPFASLADVRAYFGADRPALGEVFAEVMRQDPDGWRPRAHTEHVLATVEHWAARDHRPELALVKCPALVVAGGRSDNPVPGQREAADLLPDATFALLPESGHVLHREDPAGWRAAVEPFAAVLCGRDGGRARLALGGGSA
ncbi:alpha/beta hydrolase [Catellatospora citrea]|uniref:alpha/beta fold hydrolase n=1 Tax=Catellatospora citrea TaxID=53366 RepID=UPI00340EAA87